MQPGVLTFLLTALATVAVGLSSASLVVSAPTGPDRQLGRVLLEVVEGPLREKWLVLLFDSSAERFLPLESLLESLSVSSRPLFLLSRPRADWEDHLPPVPVLRDLCAVVLVTGDWPGWLAGAGERWAPATLLIFNVNSSWDSASLMGSSEVQTSASLALIEARKQDQVDVHTSRPLSRDSRGHKRFKVSLGSWDARGFGAMRRLFPDRFRTLGGEVLHLASDLDDYPFLYQDADGGADGINIRILTSLGSWLNFTFTTTKHAADGNWGELVNGTWNGLLGEVYRGEKNLTVNYFTVVHDRIQSFDHTATYFSEGFGFALQIPPPLPAWRSLIYPFTSVLWVCVGGILLLTTPVLFFLARISSERPISLQDAAIEVFRSLVRQSSPRVFRAGVVRVLLTAWWVGGLILVVSYTCNLIAVLTVPVFPPSISTIEGLAESDHRIAMVDYGEFVPEALATSNDRYLKALGSRMDLVYNFEDDSISYNELLQLVLKGGYAITDTYSYLRNLVGEDARTSQKTYLLREQIYSGALAFFLPKHTPWRSRFDQGIERLLEAGMVNKWYRDIMGEADVGVKAKVTGAEKALTLSNLQGPFLLLGLGLSAALLAFLGEVLAPKRGWRSRLMGR